MSTMLTISQFTLGVTLGVLIACSPTRFNNPAAVANACDGTDSNCVVSNGYIERTQNFNVGAGKVDILFINDNSASMSPIQAKLGARFQGFIQNLESKNIDYRIAVTTTDVAMVTQKRLVTFGNGKSYLEKNDSDKVVQFNNAIKRQETIDCESVIISFFNTYGSSFQEAPSYSAQYNQKCASPDTRGIYTGYLVVSENADSFMRADAALNMILISNDEVRQGKGALTAPDTAAGFIQMMSAKNPSKYWDFNSIVVMDNSCKAAQTLRNNAGQEVVNASGPAIAGGIGQEYMNLSDSAAVDIDGVSRARGKKLNLCQSDYASNFSTMATQITDAARMFTMKCTPSAAPVVSPNLPHTWNGNKVTFQRGSENTPVSITYRCYTGAS